MKKLLLIFLTGLLVSPAFAGEFTDEGWISGWKFSPLQVDVGLIRNRKLVDECADTVLALGLFTLQQKSAWISVAFMANTLQNNYGIQINPLFPGTAADCNYGISWGVQNYSKKCRGIQAGILNYSFAGEAIEKSNERVQICGLNIADTLFLGLVNFSNEFQIGLFNFSRDATLQIGLLNYNPGSRVPWMPLLNWAGGREEK